jgi:hypothetical protein
MDVYESPLRSAIDVNRPIISRCVSRGFNFHFILLSIAHYIDSLEVGKIFGNIALLWTLHKDLYTQLENGKKERLSEVVANSFLEMIPLFGSYVAYCNRYNEALQVVVRYVIKPFNISSSFKFMTFPNRQIWWRIIINSSYLCSKLLSILNAGKTNQPHSLIILSWCVA